MAGREGHESRRWMAPGRILQQTKPPVTVRVCTRPTPVVFAAEAGAGQLLHAVWTQLLRRSE